MPTGETSSGSQDKPKNKNPESEHEPKGKPGRPSNTQSSNNRIRKDISKETPKGKGKGKANPKPNPKHDTGITNNTDFEFWKGQNLTIIKDQLNKRNYRKH